MGVVVRWETEVGIDEELKDIGWYYKVDSRNFRGNSIWLKLRKGCGMLLSG